MSCFEDERVYRYQRSVYQNGSGPDARDVLTETIAVLPRGKLLEVGCGEGELSAALNASGWQVTALDSSPRMVGLCAARGITTKLASLPGLPFQDDRFDCVVGAWVLHYLTPPAVTQALCEIRRVLRRGGRMVLATNSDLHMSELWARVPGARYRLAFSAENAAELLAGIGVRAQVVPVAGTVTFTSHKQAHAFVANQLRPRDRADLLEPFDGSLTVTRRAAVISGQVDG